MAYPDDKTKWLHRWFGRAINLWAFFVAFTGSVARCRRLRDPQSHTRIQPMVQTPTTPNQSTQVRARGRRVQRGRGGPGERGPDLCGYRLRAVVPLQVRVSASASRVRGLVVSRPAVIAAGVDYNFLPLKKCN